jgi:hypothetical protein
MTFLSNILTHPLSYAILYSLLIKRYPRNRPWRPIGFWDVKDPTLSRQSAQIVVRLSALCTRGTLLPRNIIIIMFLVLISVRGWVNPERLCKFKKSPQVSNLRPSGL